ncbi:5-formyltetrahydrofolate cyclo-ligase [Paenibacillus sp. JSM ZJ436]|uniref:5-formyltetrahydrofolate cyclo-ligase n=1 Tax=Paenibacillus sp. JSM ZJ436 TaxID=3376190 RepID=UPI0037B6E3C3
MDRSYDISLPSEAKSDLRARMKGIRDSLSPETRDRLSRQASDLAVECMKQSRFASMLIYLPFRSELDTWPIIQWAWSSGVQVIVPRSQRGSRKMELYDLTPEASLAAGSYGIPEPDPKTAVKYDPGQVPEVIWVPGLAFDAYGGRLGYGGGYFDTLRSRLDGEAQAAGRQPRWIGIGFQEQVIPQVPMEIHDLRLDGLVTDQGWMKFETGTGEPYHGA